MTPPTLLELIDISIYFGAKKNKNQVVQDISFSINENEIVGVVGESGSGKSVTSLAIMGLLPKKMSSISGKIIYQGKDLLKEKERFIRGIRGNEIAMIFQEPMSALNPSMNCGYQVSEILQLHLKISRSKAKKETLSLFEKVKLPRPKDIYKSYPHQISGGQMQRVMIAMAIACKPKLLIADEPTTALDVTVQKEIIALLKEIQKETKMSLLFISHDLNLISEIAQRVVVMYQGKIVEKGAVEHLFNFPKEKYTRALLEARPKMDVRLHRLPTISSIQGEKTESRIVSPLQRANKHRKIYTRPPILEVRNVRKEFYSNVSLFRKKNVIKAVDDVSFKVFEGETLGLVGESGCGKSTLGKAILQLEKATSGSIYFKGKEISGLSNLEMRKLRKDIQLIFQDPYSSLHPRMTIGEAISEPMIVHHIGTNSRNRKKRVFELLEKVGLEKKYYFRYPHELSGGQRQRVGIARTIVLEPKLVICDESVSALDISLQAQVLNLLNDLKEDFNFTYIFISHDLAVVKYMADQLMVMKEGKIEEIGDADEIYANPAEDYTQTLIDSIPKGK
jgi:peptide/nickel transport system ATP-binding protein